MVYVEEVRIMATGLYSTLSDIHENFRSLLNNEFLFDLPKNVCTFRRRSELVPHNPIIPIINKD